LLPAKEKKTLVDIPITIDGQPGVAKGYYDERRGVNVIPDVIRETSNMFTAPTTVYSKGKSVGGPDEIEDKWTNRGYTATGKNLTKGVVAVDPSVYPLGTILRDASSGETFIAADKHGNDNPNVIDVYQPPSEYKPENRPRQFEVIGFEDNVGTTPDQIRAQLSKYDRASGGISPGAAKKAPKSESDTEKERLAIENARLDAMKKRAEIENIKVGQQADAAQVQKQVSDAQSTIDLTYQIENSPGFPSAVGFGIGKSVFGKDEPIAGTDRADTLAMINQLKGKQFLDSVAKMKGMGALSDAEGRKLEQAAARLDPNMSEAAFKKSLQEIRETLAKGIATKTGKPPESYVAPSGAENMKSDLQELINGR